MSMLANLAHPILRLISPFFYDSFGSPPPFFGEIWCILSLVSNAVSHSRHIPLVAGSYQGATYKLA